MARTTRTTDLLQRYTSRKFLLAVAAFVTATLAAAGVIDQPAEATTVEYIASALYIIVEGARDIFGR